MAAPEGKQGFVVDVDTGVVRRDRVLVQRTPAAVVVMGFGPRAEELRRFACAEAADDDDPFLDRCRGVAQAIEGGRLAKTGRARLPRSVLKINDRTLRRLAIAEALAKAGFDPDEPRDERGRWTSGGEDASESAAPPTMTADRSVAAGAATLDAAAAADFAENMGWRPAWAFEGELSLETRLGLGLLTESFAAPAVFLGTIFIPSNSDLKRQGTAPGRPDITYEFDEDTGTLKLSRDGALFYAGQNQAGTFRDAKGRVFGHDVGGNIVLDPEALPPAVTGTRPLLRTDTGTTEPKVCPATTPESTNGRSQQAIAYQEQVTQLPPGLDIKLINPKTGGPVSFDGCCTPGNPYCYLPGDYLIEAKAKEYEKFMLTGKTWQEWYRGAENIEAQMTRQNVTAGAAGWKVIWHFAEPGPAVYFRGYAIRQNLSSIDVFYTPAELP